MVSTADNVNTSEVSGSVSLSNGVMFTGDTSSVTAVSSTGVGSSFAPVTVTVTMAEWVRPEESVTT